VVFAVDIVNDLTRMRW